jgi:hypothetical protein
VKQQPPMGGSRTFNEACSQALKLETAKTVTGPPARLRVVRVGSAKGPGAKCHRTWQHLHWQHGGIGQGGTANRNVSRRTACEEVNWDLGNE